MKLWLIEQGIRNGSDTFDSMVVAAKTEEAARKIHPTQTWDHTQTIEDYDFWKNADVWADSPDQVTVEYLGTAALGTEEGVIVASFNAG